VVAGLEVHEPEVSLSGPLLPDRTESGGRGLPDLGELRLASGRRLPDILDLRIVNGRIHYLGPAGTDLLLPEVQVDSRRFLEGGRLAATVRVRGGRLTRDTVLLEDAGAGATFVWEGRQVRILEGEIEAPGTGRIEFAGETLPPAKDQSAPGYRLQVKARLGGETLSSWLSLPDGVELAGPISWSGAVEGEGSAWRLTGDLRGPDVLADGARVASLTGAGVSISRDALELTDLDGRLLSGGLAAGLRAGRRETGWWLGGSATLAGADLGRLAGRRFWPSWLPRIDSRLALDVDGLLPLGDPPGGGGSWRLELVPGQEGRGTLWLRPEGTVEGRLADGEIEIPEARLSVEGVDAEVAGHFGLDGRIGGRTSVAVNDLALTYRRLRAHVASVRPLPDWRPEGALSWAGEVAGSWSEPSVSGRLEGFDLGLHGIPLGRLEADVRLQGRELRLEMARLAGPLGSLEVAGVVPLGDLSGMHVRWEAREIDLAVAARLLAWEGNAAGRVEGSGLLEVHAGEPALQVRVAGRDLSWGPVRADRAGIEASATPRGLTLDRFTLTRGEGSVRLSGELPWLDDGGEPGEVEFEVDSYPLGDLLPVRNLEGGLSLSGRLAGSAAAPLFVGRVPFELNGIVWKGVPLPDISGAGVVQGQVLLVQLSGGGDMIRAEAALDVRPGTVSHGSIRLTGIALPLPVPGLGAEAMLGDLEARFQGPLTRPQEIRTYLEARSLALVIEGESLELREPLVITGQGLRNELAPTRFTLGPQELTVGGQVEWGALPVYSLSVVGSSDLQLWERFVAPARVRGTASLDLEVRGRGEEFQVTGSLDLDDAYFRWPGFPQAIEEISARLELDNGTVELERMSGRLGGGTVTGEGLLRFEDGKAEQYVLLWTGRQVSLSYPQGFDSLSDFDLTLEGSPAGALISGDVRLLQGRYTKDLNLEKRMLSTGLPPDLPPPPGPLDLVRLDLNVSAPGQLWIDNDLVRAEIEADLQVRGTAARPILEGSVALASAGRLTFQRVRYSIEGGSALYSPVHPNDPELSFQARTELDDYRVFLELDGRLSSPRLELSSEPDLEQDEIAVLLLTGKVWKRSDNAPASPGVMAAYLGGALGIDEGLSRIWGIDETRIDPVFVEGQGSPVARLTLTERLSPKLEASWSTLLGRTQGDTADMRYRVLPHLELRTGLEETGATVIEGRYVRSFKSRAQRKMQRKAGEVPATESGEFFKLGTVSVEGAPEPPGEESLLSAMGLGAGLTVDRRGLVTSANRGRRLLVRQGYPRARIECEPPPGSDATAEIDLPCRVEAGPRVALEIEGARNKKESRHLDSRIREEWLESFAADDLVETAVEAVEAVYHQRGRARVTVDGSETLEGDLTRIRLVIDPGPKVRVTKVRLTGVENLDEGKTRSHLGSAGRTFVRRRLLTPDLLARDRETLRRLYMGRGYLDVKVSPPEVEFHDADEATVTFPVSEGERQTLAGISFAGHALFTDAELREELSPPEGGYPEPQALEQVAVNLQAMYDRRGHPDASVIWRLERVNPGVQVAYEIREGPFVRVGEIRVEGNSLTREEVIRRQMVIRSGDPFRREDMFRSQRRVRDLDLFRSVVVRTADQPGEEVIRDVIFRVTEKKYVDVAGGLGFDNEEGIRASGSVGHRNLFGKAGSLALQGRWSSKLRWVELRTGWRKIAGSQYDFLGSLSKRYQEFESYTEFRDTLAFQVSRPWNRNTTIQIRYGIQDVKLEDVILLPLENRVQEGRLGSLGSSLVRNTLDDAFNPRKGGYRSVDLSVYADVLGSDAQFTKLFLQGSRFWSFGPRQYVFSFRAQLGFQWPFGETDIVPLPERFFAGGIQTVRGYDQDRLGPLSPITNVPVGGESVFVLNNEFQVPLTGRINFHVFVDSGNVFLRAQDLDLTDLRFTAGPGVSIRTPAGPVRAYYGWKLDPEPGESAGRFHFTFGPVF